MVNKGSIALLALNKARKTRDTREKARLKTIAKKTSLIGIFISLFILLIAITLFYFHEKIIFILNESNNLAAFAQNQSLENNSSMNRSMVLETRFPKHKLHYEGPMESEMNTVFTASKKLLNSPKVDDQQMRTSTLKSTTSVKLYDQLNILVDHDLFMNLIRKYKILKDSNLLNVTNL